MGGGKGVLGDRFLLPVLGMVAQLVGDITQRPALVREQRDLDECRRLSPNPLATWATLLVPELFFPASRTTHHSTAMAVTKTIQVSGTGARPTRGQLVTIAYTGWLKDTSQPGNRGQE